MLSDDDIRSDATLKSEGFSAELIKDFHKLVADYKSGHAQLVAATSAQNYELVIELEPSLEYMELKLKYWGKNPKQVPVADLKALLDRSGFSTEEQYIKRVKNPASGVRAFCVSCQGGDIAGVRACEAVTCVLWPFRMGKDPLRSKILPPSIDMPFEGDDAVEVNENEDTSDATE